MVQWAAASTFQMLASIFFLQRFWFQCYYQSLRLEQWYPEGDSSIMDKTNFDGLTEPLKVSQEPQTQKSINVRKTQILNKNGCRSRESRICCLPCTYPYPKKYVLCIRWNSLFVAAQNEWQHPVSVPWGWLQAANLRQGRTMCLCQKFITELWANCSNMRNAAILSWWTCQKNAGVTWLIPPIFVSAEYLAEDIHQKNTGQPEHLCDLMLNHMFCDLKN